MTQHANKPSLAVRLTDYWHDSIFVVCVVAISALCTVLCDAIILGLMWLLERMNGYEFPKAFKMIGLVISSVAIFTLLAFVLWMHLKGLYGSLENENVESVTE